MDAAAAIWIARLEYRAAALRSSSSGPDHRNTGGTEEMPTPAEAVTAERGNAGVVDPGMVEEGEVVARGQQIRW